MPFDCTVITLTKIIEGSYFGKLGVSQIQQRSYLTHRCETYNTYTYSQFQNLLYTIYNIASCMMFTDLPVMINYYGTGS